MRILALETSTESGSCALWQEGETLAADCPADAPHSETLLPLAQQLLAAAQSGFAALDAIAFDMGPGMFTGLRVACGIAQGIAAALDKPVLPIGSLECMAHAAGGERVLSLLDARMGEVYAGAFQQTARDGPRTAGTIRLLRPEDLALPDDWPRTDAVRVVGNALLAYPQLAERFCLHRCLPRIRPHAKPLVELAALAFRRGEGQDPALALPRYVRDKVAYTTAERAAARGHCA
ncbi:MAG: tRNA (adenosine(37)-N6)-threonylcarbamoyltransferase complex dimerization subunit type 1 TsaB [Zoogloeaceae bacterium]|jgi:tRNA threonylcarbamoyladenosine biosynthesis protein TsaB|nr:tRNA (adenosine(37)-N6)-threonylcarbamoyltransferase complex dimerization subunit type 1 TsaB [Zoogloeaceae bacterium]